jgi:hypothetical protein
MTEKRLSLLVKLVTVGIAVLMTVMAFSNQPCDIDAVYLSCRVTGSVGDVIGFILFYGFAAVIGGFLNPVLKLLGLEYTKGSAVNIAAGVAGVLGVILIWNL